MAHGVVIQLSFKGPTIWPSQCSLWSPVPTTDATAATLPRKPSPTMFANFFLSHHAGTPTSNTSNPPCSWLLLGILPSFISSALCAMAGSLPMLAMATTSSPLV